MPEFQGVTCRGSVRFGNGCGHCAKCEWEQQRILTEVAAGISDSAPKPEQQLPEVAGYQRLTPEDVEAIKQIREISERVCLLLDDLKKIGVDARWIAIARYVDEFTFRLNQGNVARHTFERLDAFVDGVAGKRLTYKQLTAKVSA
jgi:hypothetical protein